MEKTPNGKNPIPDYEHLFRQADEQKKRKEYRNEIPKLLIKQNFFTIISSGFLYIIKS